MEENNRAYIMQMIAGDEAAFDEVYRSCSGKLYRMAYFITGSRSDSEDVLQETFVKCFLHRKELKDPERFDSWICQILVRTAWRFMKRKKGRGELSYDGILECEADTGMAERIRRDTGSTGEEPLQKVMESEQAEELWRAVGGLDVRYRTVILLYYYNDYSIRQIARMTGTLEGTVKSRLHKARSLLKNQLLKETAGQKEAESKGKNRRFCHE
ncbi:MAG: RNA polymerase sigma factor [Eubacteriales bacterium]|nr:RNA polymerase sigma factor [Eubacteriales bacterium]